MQLPLLIDPEILRKAILVHDRLCAVYGCPIPYFSNHDPLSELISALLSHRTKNADSHRAFQQLTQQFPTWQAVRDAPTTAVQTAIAPCTWAEQKAPRIQQVLRKVSEQVIDGQILGEKLDDPEALNFLAAMPVTEARTWLESLPGVGPKTSAAVLSFSRLRRRALAVDSHHHRVAVRLGLISAKVDVGAAHTILEAQLPEDWTPQQVYDNHESMMLHGQKCCFYRNPACERCAVFDLCPFGQARHHPGKTLVR